MVLLSWSKTAQTGTHVPNTRLLNMANTPIKHCYWVVPCKLLAGEYPRDLDDVSSRAKIKALLDAGVTTFIDLTTLDDGLKPYVHLFHADEASAASYQRFPIPDLSVPTTDDAMAAILDAIDGHLRAERVVYVHCWGGVGRTGTVVGCWLARTGRDGEAALVRLRELWRQCPKSAGRTSPETREQEQFIRNWKAGK